jgi:hypothetical protein
LGYCVLLHWLQPSGSGLLNGHQEAVRLPPLILAIFPFHPYGYHQYSNVFSCLLLADEAAEEPEWTMVI